MTNNEYLEKYLEDNMDMIFGTECMHGNLSVNLRNRLENITSINMDDLYEKYCTLDINKFKYEQRLSLFKKNKITDLPKIDGEYNPFGDRPTFITPEFTHMTKEEFIKNGIYYKI